MSRPQGHPEASDHLEELESRRRTLELGVLAAACVWRRNLGTETEETAANQLLRYIEEWESVSYELDRSISKHLKNEGRT